MRSSDSKDFLIILARQWIPELQRTCGQLSRLMISLSPRSVLFRQGPQVEFALVPVLKNEIPPVRGPFAATSPKHFAKPRPICRGLHDRRAISYGIILSNSKRVRVGRKSEGKRRGSR